jgi:hypothetical protein
MVPNKARCTRTGIHLAIGLGAAGPLLLFGAPGVAATPNVDGPGDGTYLLTVSDGQTETWKIDSSCAPGCLTVSSDHGWSKKSVPDQKYQQGDWYVPDVVGYAICPDGYKLMVGSQSYTFNAVTLTGSIQVSLWSGCADHGGGKELPPNRTFAMSKI